MLDNYYECEECQKDYSLEKESVNDAGECPRCGHMNTAVQGVEFTEEGDKTHYPK